MDFLVFYYFVKRKPFLEDCEQSEYRIAICFIFWFSVLFSFILLMGVCDVELKRKIKGSLFYLVRNDAFAFFWNGELSAKVMQAKKRTERELEEN